MSRVDEMRGLVDKLTDAHVNRTQDLNAIRQDVRDSLDTFQANREAVAAETRATLAAERQQRTDSVAASKAETVQFLDNAAQARQVMAEEMQSTLAANRAHRAEAVGTLRADAQDYMAGVTDARMEMSADLFSDLWQAHSYLVGTVTDMLNGFAGQRDAMAEDQNVALAAARAEREAKVNQLKADTQQMMAGIAGDRAEMADALHQTLAQDREARDESVAAMRADIQALLAQIAADNQMSATDLHAFLAYNRETRSEAVADLMTGITTDRQAMAEELAARLHDFRAVMQTDVSASLMGFAADRSELRDSLNEMAAIWQQYSAAMRGGSPDRTNGEPAMPEAPGAMASAPKEPESAEPEEMTDEERLLEVLAAHPEGLKLVDMEPQFDLSRPQLGKLLRNLLDAGRVVKDPETLIYKLT